MSCLIGISGKSKSGKDLVGKILIDLNKGFSEEVILTRIDNYEVGTNIFGSTVGKIKKFSTKVKQMTCLALDCTMEDLESHTYKDTSLGPKWRNLTPRHIMERLAEETCREICPNFWINALFEEYDDWKEMKFNFKWFITDVRYLNEVNSIKKRNGSVIRINRPHIKSKNRHKSEISLDNYSGFDYIITYKEDLKQLIKDVKLIWEDING